MEETQIDQEAFIKQMYGFASQLFKRGMSTEEIKSTLIERGLDETNATYIADSFEREFGKTNVNRAQKDMLYGALWCVGGIMLTIAHIGFIFWGAIVFGAIRFFRGVSRL